MEKVPSLSQRLIGLDWALTLAVTWAGYKVIFRLTIIAGLLCRPGKSWDREGLAHRVSGCDSPGTRADSSQTVRGPGQGKQMGMTAILFLSLWVRHCFPSNAIPGRSIKRLVARYQNLLLEQQESHLQPPYSPYGLLHQNHLGSERP